LNLICSQTEVKMSHVYLLLGGNTGNRMKNLNNAVEMIGYEIGKIIRTSSVYETEPFGFRDKRQFFNMCVLVETELSPQQILKVIPEIEASLGRKRKTEKYVSRTIDLDILFYDDIILNELSLKIPHPEFHKRNFALIPMAEISPEFIHPIIGKTVGRLLEESTDSHRVVRFRDPLF
jgi:2-amino-4-hydroxy-6-hydroxymethyldihydropteridine diphosphokinase